MMKTIVLIIVLMIGANGFGQTDSNKLLASCCSETGRCTGSAYCSACKNCSGCKHCSKNGGSCGVCSTSSSKKYTSTIKYKRKTETKGYSTISKKRSINETLYVSVVLLNLRKGPGSKFKIIEKLRKNAQLLYLGEEKLWIKVKVKESGLIGYIYTKDLEIITELSK